MNPNDRFKIHNNCLGYGNVSSIIHFSLMEEYADWSIPNLINLIIKMSLNVVQKTSYLSFLNATMILRSIGQTYKKDKDKLMNFKKRLFREIEFLTKLMDNNRLTNKKLRSSIKSLSKDCKISIGQSQKCINVILKCHFYLCNNRRKMKQELDCPLDSVVLKALKRSSLKLYLMSFDLYKSCQKEIEQKLGKNELRIDFDNIWDERTLVRNGLIDPNKL